MCVGCPVSPRLYHAVQPAQADGLGEVVGVDVRARRHVCDGAGQPEYTMAAARGKLQPFHRGLEQALVGRRELAVPVQFRDREAAVGVTMRPKVTGSIR